MDVCEAADRHGMISNCDGPLGCSCPFATASVERNSDLACDDLRQNLCMPHWKLRRLPESFDEPCHAAGFAYNVIGSKARWQFRLLRQRCMWSHS